MNILVVDDEYYIAKSIVDNIDWASFGIKNAITAYSAEQAKNIFRGPDRIDLLLTDIEMPRENGLSLIRWAIDNGFDPLVLILTGHQNFDYAREAVNLHIFSYILKPADHMELEKQLKKAVEEIERRVSLRKTFEQSLHNLEAFADPGTVQKAEARRDSFENSNRTDSYDPVETIKQFVNRNLSNPDLDRKMIANEVHMNPDYMSHLFSTRTGSSLSGYVTDIRMDEAKRLLVSSRLSLSEISERTGFSNTSYFHRQFRKAVGMTPLQYREINS